MINPVWPSSCVTPAGTSTILTPRIDGNTTTHTLWYWWSIDLSSCTDNPVTQVVQLVTLKPSDTLGRSIRILVTGTFPHKKKKKITKNAKQVEND